ncbi:MAG: AraC family transcriptional regulator [Clostridia bacterium]|nr:AraC family transcriptional regulator [Clostridia bacterium]
MKAFFENKTYEDGVRINVWQGSDLSFLAHWHREIELVYVCEGEIRMGVNNTERLLCKGDYCIVDSSDIHFYDSQDLHSTVIIIIFDPSILGVRDFRMGMQRFLNPFIEHAALKNIETDLPKKIRNLFSSIVEEYEKRSPYFEMYIKCKLLEIWTLSLRHFPTVSSTSDEKPSPLPFIKAIKSSINYLENNYAAPITLEDLAGHVNLSPYYFSRLFKRISGMNFKEYLDTIRIEKAEAMIKDHAGSISQIALDCGFNSLRTFNRVFKSVKGYPPSKAR